MVFKNLETINVVRPRIISISVKHFSFYFAYSIFCSIFAKHKPHSG